jgi:hypothetical protein
VSAPQQASDGVVTLPSPLEQAVLGVAKDAAQQVLPKVEKALQEFVIREMAKESQAVPEVPNAPDINLSDVLHKEAARTAALKSLTSGLGLAIFTGVGAGVADAAGLNWFTKEGAIAAGVLVISSVWHGVQTYLSQLKVTAGT